MAVPKQRKTKGKRNQRRAHIFLKEPALTACPKCGQMKRPHTVCGHCGYFKGREVVNVLAKLEKKEKKARQAEMKKKEKEETKGKKPLTLEELSKQKF